MKKPTNYWASFEEEGSYHIYNRGINRCNIFTLPKNYHFFLSRWKKLIHPFFEMAAYCLLPNHFHFLVSVRPITPALMESVKQQRTSKSVKFLAGEISYNTFLEDQFKRLFSSYALAFNKQENRTGSLFQKRFKRVRINSELKLWNILAYIHHNPIHHRYKKEYGHWEFCSYQAYGAEQTSLLAREKVLNWFNIDRQKAMQAFLRHHKNFKIEKLGMDYDD
ncbi:MAG: hypothetical protein AAFN81_01110 [Bacteroidota bacterium]